MRTGNAAVLARWIETVAFRGGPRLASLVSPRDIGKKAMYEQARGYLKRYVHMLISKAVHVNHDIFHGNYFRRVAVRVNKNEWKVFRNKSVSGKSGKGGK